MHDHIEKISIRTTNWIGTPASLVAHTMLFVAIFGLQYAGWTFDQILLVLTTAVSLEAIYLAIFIQMTVNRHAEQLAEVGEDVEDIQEEVEDLGEDVVEISEDIEKIQEEQTEDAKTQAMLENIQSALHTLITEVETLKTRPHANGTVHAHHDTLPAVPVAELAIGSAPEPEEQEGRESSNYFKRFMGFISLKNKTLEPTDVQDP